MYKISLGSEHTNHLFQINCCYQYKNNDSLDSRMGLESEKLADITNSISFQNSSSSATSSFTPPLSS
jgi:hypothetical protein